MTEQPLRAVSDIQFVVNEPVDIEQRGRNIAHALSLGHKDADCSPLYRMNIFANGPSLADVDFSQIPGRTAAVNGALATTLAKGFEPDFWAACDPQPLVADFIPTPAPAKTTYLVASKCDPAVFAKLEARDVRLWHIRDHPLVEGRRAVKCASSVTLCLLTLFRQMGYRDFHVYGWDGCYVDGLHHAGEPPREPTENDMDVIAGADVADDRTVSGGRTFHTTRTWVLEAHDAVLQLHHVDYSVKIYGDGLIKAVTGR
jgi:hypothetical protein